jgi:hypothetical protein
VGAGVGSGVDTGVGDGVEAAGVARGVGVTRDGCWATTVGEGCGLLVRAAVVWVGAGLDTDESVGGGLPPQPTISTRATRAVNSPIPSR